MRNLLLFIIKNKDHFVFAVTVTLSISLLFNRNNDEMSVVRGFSSDIVSFLSSPMVKVKSLAIVSDENQLLREKNLQLNLQLESILYAADENKNLRELLDFKRETKLKIIPASIINKGIQTNIKALTIDVGSRDSVFANQAVLTPYGVIGKTIQVGKNSAIVQSISDNNFRLSVRIMPSGAVGILRWFDSNTCKVYEIQKNVEVNIGDRVITSGFSKIYPPKLPVGIVSGVYDERGSYQKVINVSIQNDFESIQNVFIVLGEK
ncbi:MAG: rod shape-determining protein MreC [Candidatus Marinimicrobia bacterium]|mgnify:FL=1|nr:rod shape-determining protein MreC [Candidatus Neomarinimicrobiota bacterium]|tara:strand:- start:1276 stop:2064 length:789 start_codon:yes stop_codon:yes gene_type:complete